MSKWRNLAFSLRQLQYAVAVAETGGFGVAAEACGVSQPSLSAQVAKLESELGVQLFERHARGIQITTSGRELLEAMRGVLAQARVLESAARVAGDPASAVLAVGLIPTVAPYLLPPLVEILRGRAGVPRVRWVEQQTEACEQGLADGELDAIVIADPPTHPSFDAVDIGWESFVLVVASDHPLRGPVSLRDVAPYDLLLLEEGHCLRDHTLSLCMAPGARESPYRATSLPTLVQMVASGLGVSVLPASAVGVEALRARVRTLPFSTTDVGRTLRVAWRSRSPHVAVLRELAGAMREALSACTG